MDIESTEAKFELVDFTKPQKHFSYPHFAGLPEVDDPIIYIQQVVSPRNPKSVRLSRNLSALVEDFLDCHSIGVTDTVGIQKPYPEEFFVALSGRCRVRILPRDPEEFFESDLSEVKALLLSNPSRPDGFYYPQENYEQILNFALKSPGLLILSEESFGLFSFNNEAPGSAKNYLATGRVFTACTIFPAHSPQGPELSWWQGQAIQKSPLLLNLNAEELKLGLRALLAFQNRQGRAVGEFQRRMLVLRKGLRDFLDELKPALLNNLIHIPLWPDSGFYLIIDLSQALQRSGQSLEAWLREVEEKYGLRLRSAAAFGFPNSIQLCFAANPKALRDLGKKLLLHLT